MQHGWQVSQIMTVLLHEHEHLFQSYWANRYGFEMNRESKCCLEAILALTGATRCHKVHPQPSGAPNGCSAPEKQLKKVGRGDE